MIGQYQYFYGSTVFKRDDGTHWQWVVGFEGPSVTLAPVGADVDDKRNWISFEAGSSLSSEFRRMKVDEDD